MLEWGRAILCLVVDRANSVLPLEVAVREACAGGVDWIQLRERELAGGELLAWCESLVCAAQEGASAAGSSGDPTERRVATIVNRRIDVALALAVRERADGVHLGFDAFAPQTARRLLGPAFWIGVSTHSPDELVRLARVPEGETEPAIDYAHLAPIFQPISKAASRPPLGLAGLRAVSRCGVPVLAQGGLQAGNARQAIEAGAAGIAVTGALLASKDPRKAARELREALDSAR